MNNNLIFAAFLGATSVVIGAFVSHALQDSLTVKAINGLNTAVRYQMYHALLLLFINEISSLTTQRKNRLTYLIGTGVLFFSGSIYAIYLLKIPASSIWFVTPLGGLFLILGWLGLILYYIKKPKNTSN